MNTIHATLVDAHANGRVVDIVPVTGYAITNVLPLRVLPDAVVITGKDSRRETTIALRYIVSVVVGV